jgi:hypothetical protein
VLAVCGYADQGLTNRYRPIIRFDLSSIPTSTTINSAKVAFKQPQAGIWYAFNVKSRVQCWVTAPSSNYGWVLKCTDENRHNQDYFTSANNTDTIHRPRLVVNY